MSWNIPICGGGRGTIGIAGGPGGGMAGLVLVAWLESGALGLDGTSDGGGGGRAPCIPSTYHEVENQLKYAHDDNNNNMVGTVDHFIKTN